MENCIFHLTLDLRETKKQARQKIKEFNDALKENNPQEHKKLCIKGNTIHVLWSLLNFYYNHLFEMKKLKPSEMPVFKTNNAKLARNTGYSKSTIFRHIKRLRDADVGILLPWSKDNFHGTKADYDIEFNPKWLIANQEGIFSIWVKWAYMKMGGLNMISMEKLREFNELRPSFLHAPAGIYKIATCNHISNRTFNNINMISGVSEFTGQLTTQNASLLSGEFTNNLVLNNLTEHGENAKGVPGAENNQHSGVNNQKSFPGEKNMTDERKKIELYTYSAWNFAYTMLWKDKKFPPERIEEAKRHIFKYFSENNYPNYAQQVLNCFCQRIILTSRYINRAPERFVPLPDIYFDPFFKQGFAGTKQWLQNVFDKRKTNKNYYSNIKLFSKVYRDYCRDMSLQNYNKARQLLSRTKDDKLLSTFNECVLNYQEFNPGLFTKMYQQHLKRNIISKN